MREIWKNIPGTKIYMVSSLGRVRSINRTQTIKNRWGGKTNRKKPGVILSQKDNGNGYRVVNLYAGSIPLRERYVHRLVCLAFFGIGRGQEVNHKNGIKHDNMLLNLEVVSSTENRMHAIRNGLLVNDNSGGKILNPDAVRAIRSTLIRGRNGNGKVLAKKYGKSLSTILAIGKGSIHKDVI